jgi:hypothetical protein
MPFVKSTEGNPACRTGVGKRHGCGSSNPIASIWYYVKLIVLGGGGLFSFSANALRRIYS